MLSLNSEGGYRSFGLYGCQSDDGIKMISVEVRLRWRKSGWMFGRMFAIVSNITVKR